MLNNHYAVDIIQNNSLLPAELLYEVFSYFGDSQPTLYAIALVCKQWARCVAPLLYAHPRISNTYRWATFLLTLVRNKPMLFHGDFVHSIDLSVNPTTMALSEKYPIDRLTNRPPKTFRSLMKPEPLEKGPLSCLIVSTSSLLQLAHACKYITCLNLSYTGLLRDTLIEETGEYTSSPHTRPGLTHTEITLETAIRAIGQQCRQLEKVEIKRCEWVTAKVIWLFTDACPNLIQLDARRSTKCTVKSLIANVLQVPSLYTSSSLFYDDSYCLYQSSIKPQQVTSLREMVKSMVLEARQLGTQGLEWIEN